MCFIKKDSYKKKKKPSSFLLGVSPLNTALCSSMPIICLLLENGPQKKAWKNEKRGGGEKEKHERRKQFETVAVSDRRGRMRRERETVSSGVS